MKVCSSCSTRNVDLSQFCSECGKKLSDKTICPHCSKEAKSTDTFCRYCGKNLEDTKAKKPSKNPQKRKMSKLKKSLIALGSFFGFLVIAYIALFFVGRFYLFEKYTIQYQMDGSKKIVEQESLTELSFNKLTICDRVDTNTYAPLSSSSQFDIGFKEVYATINVNGITEDDNYSFKWIREENGEELINFTNDYFAGEGYFSGNVHFPLVISPDENINEYQIFNEPGKYRAEFYNNDKLISSASFDVVAPEVLPDKHVIFGTFDKGTLKPLKSESNFKLEQEQLFSGVHMSGRVQKEDSFNFMLRNKLTDEILKEYKGKYSDLTRENYFNDYIYFYIRGPFSDKEITLNPGDYEVEFYHNKELKSSTPFKINPLEQTFSDLVLSKDTGTDHSPVDPTDYFILGTKKICASVYVSDADSDDTWKFIWATKNKDKIIKEFEDTYNVGEDGHFSGYQSISLYIPEGQGVEGVDIFGYPGEYLVEFYHNNELISSNVFKIIDTGVSFDKLIICEDTDDNNRPINQATEFSYLTKSIYATINISGAAPEDECRLVIKEEGSNEIMRDFIYTYKDSLDRGEDTYDGCFIMNLEPPGYRRAPGNRLLGNPGNYVIEFYHNGFLIGSSGLKITECIKEQDEKLTVRLFEMVEAIAWPGKDISRTTDRTVKSGLVSGTAHTPGDKYPSPNIHQISDGSLDIERTVRTLIVRDGTKQSEDEPDIIKMIGISPAADVEEIVSDAVEQIQSDESEISSSSGGEPGIAIDSLAGNWSGTLTLTEIYIDEEWFEEFIDGLFEFEEWEDEECDEPTTESATESTEGLIGTPEDISFVIEAIDETTIAMKSTTDDGEETDLIFAYDENSGKLSLSEVSFADNGFDEEAFTFMMDLAVTNADAPMITGVLTITSNESTHDGQHIPAGAIKLSYSIALTKDS